MGTNVFFRPAVSHSYASFVRQAVKCTVECKDYCAGHNTQTNCEQSGVHKLLEEQSSEPLLIPSANFDEPTCRAEDAEE